MAIATDAFAGWLQQADIALERLRPYQQALLESVFRFRQRQGDDYFSTRLLSHFLLHCDCGLKVAAIARLLGISRPTASGHQGVSSKQLVQQAHHRLDGRPYGKLLPRYAGPVAQFLLTHPDATRLDLLDFIDATFAVRVSRIALYKFLKKFGLNDISSPVVDAASLSPAANTSCPAAPLAAADTASSAAPVPLLVPDARWVLAGPAPPFSSHAPNTPAPSC